MENQLENGMSSRTVRRFDSATREKIQQRITALFAGGVKSANQITLILRKEGVTMSDGSALEFGWVKKNICDLGLLIQSMPTLQTQPKLTKRLPESALAILTDPQLTDSQVVRMLKDYAEV